MVWQLCFMPMRFIRHISSSPRNDFVRSHFYSSNLTKFFKHHFRYVGSNLPELRFLNSPLTSALSSGEIIEVSAIQMLDFVSQGSNLFQRFLQGATSKHIRQYREKPKAYTNLLGGGKYQRRYLTIYKSFERWLAWLCFFWMRFKTRGTRS